MEVFIVTSNFLEKRLDPHFYRPTFLEFEEKIKKNDFYLIDNISDVICGPFGSAILVSDYKENGIPLIRISNINSDSKLVFKNVTYISDELATKLSNYRVVDGDIIISQRGTLGLSAIVTKEFNNAVISANFIAIKNIKSIKPKFLKYFFDTELANIQLEQRISGQVQVKLTTEDIKTVKVPKIDENNQNKIIQIMDEAYSRKKQNEKEAERLIGSIDDVIGEHLKIKTVEYSSANITIINSNEIQDRLDPLFYISGNLDFLYGDLNLVILENVCNYFKTGFAAGKHSQAKDANGILQIRPTNINIKGKLYFEKNIYIDYPERERRKEDLIKKDEILFNNTNSQELVGKSAYFNLDEDFFCSNHITRIKTNQELLSPKYLWIILNMYQRHGYFFRICTNWNNQSGININLIKTILIPIPDSDIQKNIVEEIDEIFNKYDKLISESNSIIEQAKKEVEIILFEQE